MSQGRWVVMSVTLGLVLVVVALAAGRMIIDVDGGWFMYAPDSAAPQFSSSDADTLATALIGLVAIGAWAAVSWRLFGRRSDET